MNSKLTTLSVTELKALAKELGIKGFSTFRKIALLDAIVKRMKDLGSIQDFTNRPSDFVAWSNMKQFLGGDSPTEIKKQNQESMFEFMNSPTYFTDAERERLAILYCEKHGIIEYEVLGNDVVYVEHFPTEGTYRCSYNLVAKKESRKKVS